MAKLTPLQLDALGESGNISMGAAATALSQLLGHNVQITTPRLSYTTLAEIRGNHPVPCVLIRVNYSAGLEGSNVFILADRDAGVIANMMMGNADQAVPDLLDELYLSAVSEAMNQMMGSSATAMSEMFSRTIDITPPQLQYINLQNQEAKIDGFDENEQVVQVAFDLTVGTYIASTMLQILPEEFAERLVLEMLGSFDALEEQNTAAERLTASDKELLKEISNISISAAATALAEILTENVSIEAVSIRDISAEELKKMEEEDVVIANIQYQDGFLGVTPLVFFRQDALTISSLMMGLPVSGEADLDDIRLSALAEAVNQMFGASATTLSKLLALRVEIAPPEVLLPGQQIHPLSAAVGTDIPVQVTYRLMLGQYHESRLVQILPWSLMHEMIRLFSKPIPGSEPLPPVVDLEWDKPLRDEALQALPERHPLQSTESREALPDHAGNEGTVHLDLLRDIPVRVTGVLGRCKLPLSDLMKVTSGSVVEMDAAADDAVEILANGKLVARGQIILYKEQLGIKITEIIQPWQHT